MKVEYPKWLYHATKPPRVVRGPEEQAALGPGWAESPAEVPGESPQEDRKPKEGKRR
jgi:hypothetical protein